MTFPEIETEETQKVEQKKVVKSEKKKSRSSGDAVHHSSALCGIGRAPRSYAACTIKCVIYYCQVMVVWRG